MGGTPVEAARARATLVFAGRVEEVGGTITAEGGSETRARVRVSRVWKGPDVPEIVVLPGDGSSSCGLDLARGEEWLLYAHQTEAGYSVGLCDRSTEAIAAEAARLGAPLVERVLPPLELRPMEVAVATMDADVVRAAIAAGAPVRGEFLGGTPVDAAVSACAADVAAVLTAAGAFPGQHTFENALACPDPVAMVRALGGSAAGWTIPLELAARAGDDARVSILLEGGVDPDPGREDRPTPLSLALSAGHRETADLLIRCGAVLDRRALAGAVRSRDPAIRALVFEADLTAEYATFLLPAAATDAAILELLLAHGADPNPPGEPRNAPLTLARDCAPCTGLLLAAGAVPDPLLLRQAAGGKDLAQVQHLLALGIPATAADPRTGETALEVAVTVRDNLAVIEALLAAGADPSAVSHDGTPLHAAVEPAVVTRLLAAGSDPSRVGIQIRWTALEKAASKGNLAIVQALLDGGASFAGSEPGQSALDNAAASARLEVVELLLARGAPTGTALARAQGEAVVRRLLEAGADPNVSGFNGARPLNTAARRRDPESVALLLAAGADPNGQEREGRTPLMAVLVMPVQSDRTEEKIERVVELLLAAGASKSLRDASGRSAADQATATGRTALAARLGAR